MITITTIIHHDHDHSELSETELRVRALETILTEKGYVDPAALDAIIQALREPKIGPHNGAQVVAKAWTRSCLQAGLLDDASAAVSTLGHVGRVRATTSSPSRTRRSAITWSFARCAPAIPGKCWGCRRSGTRPRPIGRAR